MNRALVSFAVAAGFSALICVPVCAADPTAPAPGPQPVPAEAATAPESLAAPTQSGNPVLEACKLFNVALNVAAVNYDEFAYAAAGNGNNVNYQDPNVARTNVIGRTALRQAAAAAMSASRTPGLPPEVSDPMRSWSLRATKLLLVMGLRGSGDTLNSSVVDLKTIGNDGQMACAANGARG